MNALRAILLLLGLLAAFAARPAEPAEDAFWFGSAADGSPVVRLHFFWSRRCPHCGEAHPFVEALPRRLPWVAVESHELDGDEAEVDLFIAAARELGEEANAVPAFVFCRRIQTGYHRDDTTGTALVAALEECRGERMAAGTAAPGKSQSPASGASLPMLGSVDLEAWSLPALTLVVATVDAFNPCAFFVLLFLLSVLVHARSRARMLVIGGVFVLFSGLVYFAFMAAWLNVFLLAGELRAATVAAGLLALIAGTLNTKDFFRLHQGPSLSIPDAARPGLFRRMREVAGAGSLAPMLAGTVLLALVANSYELLCTAGFPMIYTRALTLHHVEGMGYYGWLALYNLIYVLPLALIVLAFTRTLGARKLSEFEGRVLKLVSGYMMLGLGALLLLAPQWLANATASIAVLAGALAAAAITVKLAPKP